MFNTFLAGAASEGAGEPGRDCNCCQPEAPVYLIGDNVRWCWRGRRTGLIAKTGFIVVVSVIPLLDAYGEHVWTYCYTFLNVSKSATSMPSMSQYFDDRTYPLIGVVEETDETDLLALGGGIGVHL